MSDWKYDGLIDPDMSELYDKKYLPATHCQVCKKEFKDSFDKCMDKNFSKNGFSLQATRFHFQLALNVQVI